jgi:hypothetical protein
MTWTEIKTWLRRYLRDPDGLIWADAELLQYWNDAALEIAVKTGPVVRVETHYFPPEYECSYTWDWEVDYGEGTQYQALTVNQADGWVITYPWEAAYWLDVEPTDDDGYRDTHPWEMCLGSPADVVPVPLHAKFSKMKLAAYDEQVIDPIDEPMLSAGDGFYRTRTGEPVNYWHPDKMQNYMVLYPRPPVVWDETEVYEVLDETDGGMVADESWLDHRDTGITTDVIDLTDTIFTVYEAMPVEMQDDSDTPDFAPYLIKYVSYACLERAYGADTDGYIPSLRDYWQLRKEIGVKALMRFRRMMLTDRDFRLGGQPRTATSRRLRLPDGYPAL